MIHKLARVVETLVDVVVNPNTKILGVGVGLQADLVALAPNNACGKAAGRGLLRVAVVAEAAVARALTSMRRSMALVIR